MLLDNHTKQSPIVGVAGLGGGINSYIFLSSGGGDYVISRSLRFNSADTPKLTRTPSSASNRKTWTLAFWIKRTTTGSREQIISAAGSNNTYVEFQSDKLMIEDYNPGINSRLLTTRVFRDPSAWYHIVIAMDTTQGTSSNRLKLYVNGVQETVFDTATYPGPDYLTSFNNTGEHKIGQFPGNTDFPLNAYLADFHLVDGQQLAQTDFGQFDDAGVWQPKKFSGAHGTNGFHLDFKDNSSDAALGYDAAGSNNFTVTNLTATGGAATNGIAFDGNDKVTFPGMALGTGNLTFECFFKLDSGTSGFRRILSRTEGGAGNDLIMRVHSNGYMQWYFDSQEHTGSTTVTAGVWHHTAIVRSGSDTISYYYDGTRISTDTSNADMTLNAVILAWGNGSEYFTGQIYGARLTKQALYTGASYTVPTSAITTTSQGASSSNVVHLSATTSTTTTNSGTTGNGTNDGDPSAVSAYPFGDPVSTDSLIDSPSQSVAGETDSGLGGQITGNYATLNPLDRQSTNGTLSNGNLDLKWSSSSWAMFRSTMHVSSGKWYWEVTLGNNQYPLIGIIPTDYNMNTSTNYWMAQVPNAYSFYPYTGNTYDNTSSAAYATADQQAAGTTYGVALDLDAGTMTYYKNGVSLGVAFTGISGSFSPAASLYNASNNDSYNFGQRAFVYPAPSGFKCLTVENLSEPTIADGSAYFDTKIYEGDGVDGRSVSGFKFSPDLIWIKGRTTGSNTIQHVLQDTVRGTTSLLSSNESYDPSAFGTHWGYISSFNSDGFSMTAGAGGDDHNNYNGVDYVSWAWNAGTFGSGTTNNTTGDIPSTVRVSPSSGFSIVKWEGDGQIGRTIGHSLNKTPEFIIAKNLSAAVRWAVYTKTVGPGNSLILNDTTGPTGGTGIWGNANPTSTVFTVGADSEVNTDGSDYIAYCFTPIEGYSAVGSYIGNQNANGPFVYLGFRPRWILLRKADGGGTGYDWHMFDSERDPTNQMSRFLGANTSQQEQVRSDGANYTDMYLDFLSNGFKWRNAYSSPNNNNASFVYLAFAEHPFNTSRAR